MSYFMERVCKFIPGRRYAWSRVRTNKKVELLLSCLLRGHIVVLHGVTVYREEKRFLSRHSGLPHISFGPLVPLWLVSWYYPKTAFSVSLLFSGQPKASPDYFLGAKGKSHISP